MEILLVEKIETDFDESKDIVDFVLEKILPYVENDQLTYDEFEELFIELERKQQYHVVNMLAELNIELVDEKILPEKDIKEFEQPVYLRKANEIKLPNNMLVSLFQNGDKQSIQDLCVKNYGLVRKYVNKYLKDTLTLTENDLIQEGMIGILTAANKFDLSKETQFTTYAAWWIRQAITRATMDEGTMIRIPVHLHETIKKILRLHEKFYMQGKNYIECIEHVAQELEISTEKVKELIHIYKKFILLKSLDSPINEEKETSLIDFIPDDEEFAQPESEFMNTLLREKIVEVLNTLTPREKKIITLRFGFEDGKARTLEEVGKSFNVTRERIRQIEVKALRKLKHPSRSNKLKEILY